MQQYSMINGKFCDHLESNIHITDLGLLRGMGIFDYFLVENNVPPLFDAHMERYQNSIKGMGLEVDVDEVRNQIMQLIAKNNFGFSSIKVLTTGGFSEDEFTLSTPNTIIINRPLKFSYTELHHEGGRLITSKYQRELPHVKTTNYIQALRLQKQIRDANAVDVLYIDSDYVRECSRCNIFMVNDGVLYTPKSNILHGVTRGNVLAQFNHIAKVEDFTYEQLLHADEVFITNTTKRVLPIVWIDGHNIGNGKVGETTKNIMKKIN